MSWKSLKKEINSTNKYVSCISYGPVYQSSTPSIIFIRQYYRCTGTVKHCDWLTCLAHFLMRGSKQISASSFCRSSSSSLLRCSSGIMSSQFLTSLSVSMSISSSSIMEKFATCKTEQALFNRVTDSLWRRSSTCGRGF